MSDAHLVSGLFVKHLPAERLILPSADIFNLSNLMKAGYH